MPIPPARTPLKLSVANLRLSARPWGKLASAWDHKPIDVLFIDQPHLVSLVPLLEPRLTIYRPTDIHFDPSTRAAEDRVLELADAIVATGGHVLKDVMRNGRELPHLVLENGVEFEHFRSAILPSEARSGAIYIGALDARFDWSAVYLMCRAFPDQEFRIGGPITASPPPRAPENLTLLGPVPYSEAPKLLAKAKVGILPMSKHPGNAARSPMKYFEYLAAGLTVVATSSDELVTRNAPGVSLFDDGKTSAVEAFATALSAADDLGTDGVEYASAFSWSKRAARLNSFVDGLPS
ncbi:glycosyltransferase [Cryobacterium sp. 1639]|uniref:glycosyltransferase n=1 Tax=Cryobacterium inferilacus TaxID=2866629 RepID=UPI001C72A1D8|nr:glycosyltransferase [Cryobacterium sp. 1639]MBX0301730.1 glycosyltransferase [Cryobacterium sp. 1639]